MYYTARQFSIEHQISDKLAQYLNDGRLADEERKDISRLLHKLRRINTRNVIVHKILKGIVEHQRDYFASNNELDLKLLTRSELARIISDSSDGQGFDFMLDASRISRAIRGLSVITPKGGEVPLGFLFPSRRDMVKRCVKAILNQEKEAIGGGRIAKPYTDEELTHKINAKYGWLITRREVAYCRKELGILPYLERNGYVYHTLAADFSQMYPFTATSVRSNAPVTSGIYELCVDGEGIEYPAGCCQTFYIGSAKNLRERLLSHLASSSKNGGIKGLIKERSCLFRYLQIPCRWAQEEKRVYNLFVSTYGDSPVCNRTSPKASNR
jgi:hypothetical protein